MRDDEVFGIIVVVFIVAMLVFILVGFVVHIFFSSNADSEYLPNQESQSYGQRSYLVTIQRLDEIAQFFLTCSQFLVGL